MDLNGKFIIMFLMLESGTVILHFPSLSFSLQERRLQGFNAAIAQHTEELVRAVKQASLTGGSQPVQGLRSRGSRKSVQTNPLGRLFWTHLITHHNFTQIFS